MSLIKDMRNETEGYRLQTRIFNFLSPREWYRLHRWRKQRADRGWSDRDTWGAGDHIAKITAEMLQYLISEKGHIDWPMWFKYNIDEHGKGAYTNLQQVIDDIQGYLKHAETSWADDLHTEALEFQEGKYVSRWFYESGKQATEADITHRINKWQKDNLRLYKKAQKAMGFFGRHFTQFWD